MSLHIGAKSGEIAETVLISGDPLRAKYVTEKMLTDSFCYNEVRGMYGYTGTYNGKRVSVQGTGMGIPSTAIYVHELIHEYGVKKIIRIGTCGAIQPELELGQIVIADGSYTDSATHLQNFRTMDLPAIADEKLLSQAVEVAKKDKISIKVGKIFSTDTFYHDNGNRWERWTNNGVLGVEMESSMLYALASKHSLQALTILTVSDNIITKTYASSKDREQASLAMMRLALEIV
ncbi:MAG: purine-nucleoside phosphorylase [Flammeovirgaceae bacterium]|nr:purine-nucleoside phosphorylase [Flammeovirgaceae bacterium]